MACIRDRRNGVWNFPSGSPSIRRGALASVDLLLNDRLEQFEERRMSRFARVIAGFVKPQFGVWPPVTGIGWICIGARCYPPVTAKCLRCEDHVGLILNGDSHVFFQKVIHNRELLSRILPGAKPCDFCQINPQILGLIGPISGTSIASGSHASVSPVASVNS